MPALWHQLLHTQRTVLEPLRRLFTTVGNVTRTGSSTGTKAATGNRRRLPKAARAARAARQAATPMRVPDFRLLIMMKTTAMPVPLCPQVLKVGMHAHSSDSFRRVALSTESSSGMQQLLSSALQIFSARAFGDSVFSVPCHGFRLCCWDGRDVGCLHGPSTAGWCPCCFVLGRLRCRCRPCSRWH